MIASQIQINKIYPDVMDLSKGSSQSVGWDLRYYGPDVTVTPGTVKILPTGIKMELPNNMEAQIRSRSGLATRGIFVINSPGTIDPDYRGEIKIIIANMGPKPYEFLHQERIAQITFNKISKIEISYVADLDKTERNEGGLGSTGTR
jgi:dUTP pyrophosphatase